MDYLYSQDSMYGSSHPSGMTQVIKFALGFFKLNKYYMSGIVRTGAGVTELYHFLTYQHLLWGLFYIKT